MKENGYLLGQGQVDLGKVYQSLNDIEYVGWLHIEGSTLNKKMESYKDNRTVRSLFS